MNAPTPLSPAEIRGMKSLPRKQKILLWFALIFLAIEILRVHQNKIRRTFSFLKILKRRWIAALGLAVIVLFVGFKFHIIKNKVQQGFRIDQVKARQIYLLESRDALTTLESDSLLARLYPEPAVVRERCKILKKYGLSVFRNP